MTGRWSMRRLRDGSVCLKFADHKNHRQTLMNLQTLIQVEMETKLPKERHGLQG